MVKKIEDKKAKVGAVKPEEVKKIEEEVKVGVGSPEGEKSEAPKEEEAPKKGKKTSVVVSWRGNTREYSLTIHGENFEKLAEEFASKFDGTIE